MDVWTVMVERLLSGKIINTNFIHITMFIQVSSRVEVKIYKMPRRVGAGSEPAPTANISVNQIYTRFSILSQLCFVKC